MFTTVRYFIKTSIIFLVLGILTGLFMSFTKYIAESSYTQELISAHTHIILVGSVMMMIMGVALWFFPRAEKDDKKYNPDLILVTYWMMTIATAMRFVTQIIGAYYYLPWVNVSIVVFSSFQVLAMILFFYSMWGRIRAVGSQYREAKGKKFGTLMQNWRITGVDPSEEMIKLSRAKVIEHNLNDRVLLHHGFVDSLPEGEQYDFSTLIFVLRFIQKAEDQKSLFSAIAKRLKPGGKFIIIDQYGENDNAEFKTMLNSWKSFMKFSGSPMELVNKISQQASEKSFINEQQLQEALSEAGFEKIKCIYKSLIHGGWIAQKRF